MSCKTCAGAGVVGQADEGTLAVCPNCCPDCQRAARHAYSDATTPGFFYDKCERHRAMEIYYYGCYRDIGHRMLQPRSLVCSQTELEFLHANPWGVEIDGDLCPPGVQWEGQALIHHKDGWTVLAFWDRSIDSRPNSNSNFLAKGIFDFEQMLALAREHFPEVISRFHFQIVEVKAIP